MRREAERRPKDWVICMFSDLLIRHGRADEAVTFIDGLPGQPEDELPAWVEAMAASGRRREAIAGLRARLDAGETWIAPTWPNCSPGTGSWMLPSRS